MVSRGDESGGTNGCAEEGRADHWRREEQARQRPAQAVRQGPQHPRARREPRALLRVRTPGAVRVRRDIARPRRCHPYEEEGQVALSAASPEIPPEAGFRVDVADAVATVTLNRPERLNAQTPHTWVWLARVGAD